MENPQTQKVSDLIGNYLDNLKSTPYPRVDNLDILEGIDHVSNNLAEGIELVQTTLNQNGVAENLKAPSPRLSSSDDIYLRRFRSH